MTADEWNTAHPVGTLVTAYPLTRDDRPRYTRTRSEAWTLGHGAAVVSVEGYGGGIALTHVDVGWVLTHENYRAIDHTIDRDGVFAKGFYEYVDGALTTVGLRIGERPNHVVARYGDTILRAPGGMYAVRPADGSTS